MLFPNVPGNYWGYEAVVKLAGNGTIKGYPDGTFQGDRTMTKYEFASMLYRPWKKEQLLMVSSLKNSNQD